MKPEGGECLLLLSDENAGQVYRGRVLQNGERATRG